MAKTTQTTPKTTSSQGQSKQQRKAVRRYEISEKSQRRKKRKQILGEVSAYEQVFRFRGKSLEELQQLSLDEEISLLNANVRRTYARQWNARQQRFYDRLVERHTAGKPIRTHLRDFPVLSRMVGMTIQVHNGRTFFKVHVVQNMIGHLLGEFAQTRKIPVHIRKGIGASKSSSHVPMK